MYCMSCGTQLPEDAKFCLKCGATQATKTEQIAPVDFEDFFSAKPKNEQQEILKAVADVLFSPTKKAVEHLNTIARYGPVTHQDVVEAMKIIDSFNSLGEPLHENHILIYYQFATSIWNYYLAAWETEGKERILNDWNRYDSKGFSEFLKPYCQVNPTDRTKKVGVLLSVANGLADWLEFDLLGNLFASIIDKQIKLSEKEEQKIANLYNEKRFQEIIDAMDAQTD